MKQGRVKVSVFDLDDKDKEFKILMSRFRKAVGEYGIIQDIKQHKFYEPPGRKKRRKLREAELARMKLANKEPKKGESPF